MAIRIGFRAPAAPVRGSPRVHSQDGAVGSERLAGLVGRPTPPPRLWRLAARRRLARSLWCYGHCGRRCRYVRVRPPAQDIQTAAAVPARGTAAATAASGTAAACGTAARSRGTGS